MGYCIKYTTVLVNNLLKKYHYTFRNIFFFVYQNIKYKGYKHDMKSFGLLEVKSYERNIRY